MDPKDLYKSEKAQQPTVTESVVVVEPKVRFVGNISNEMLIIPDLRNDVDEEGLTILPGQKIDLLLYYSPREINRSRGLDNFLHGLKNPATGEKIYDPKLKVLSSMDEELPPVPLTIEQQYKGKENRTFYDETFNYADRNLADIEARDQKELERHTRNARRVHPAQS